MEESLNTENNASAETALFPEIEIEEFNEQNFLASISANGLVTHMESVLKLNNRSSNIGSSTVASSIVDESEEILSVVKIDEDITRERTIDKSRYNPKSGEVETVFDTFNGDRGENVMLWIKEFDDMAKLCKWNLAQSTLYAKMMLRGSARLYIKVSGCENTWPSIREALIKEFSIKVDLHMVHRDLQQRKKRPDETYYSYCYKMLEIASIANIDTKTVIKYIIDGVEDDFCCKPLLHGATTIRELKEKFDVFEEEYQARLNVKLYVDKIKENHKKMDASTDQITKNFARTKITPARIKDTIMYKDFSSTEILGPVEEEGSSNKVTDLRLCFQDNGQKSLLHGYKWTKMEKRGWTPNMVNIGLDVDGTNFVVGRAKHNGAVIPAKVKPDVGISCISFEGLELVKTEFEVLLRTEFVWVPAEYCQIPENAVPIGMLTNGEMLFIGRVFQNNTIFFGNVYKKRGCMYITVNDKEVIANKFEVLVQQ